MEGFPAALSLDTYRHTVCSSQLFCLHLERPLDTLNNYWQVIFKVNRTEGPRTSKMKEASLTNVTNLPPILTQFNSSLTLTIYSSATLSLDVSCFGKKKKKMN